MSTKYILTTIEEVIHKLPLQIFGRLNLVMDYHATTELVRLLVTVNASQIIMEVHVKVRNHP